MFERSPDFFKKFQKSIVYFTSDSVPECIRSFNSYAFGFHNDANQEYCSETNPNHYHFMLDKTSGPSEQLPLPVSTVPCVYSTYRCLIATASKRIFQGDVFAKLQSAVLYNSKNPDKTSASVLRKRLPSHSPSNKPVAKEAKFIEKPARSIGVQTDMLPTTTVERLQRLLCGPQCSQLLMIMDIMGSGFGSLTTNSSNNCVNFSMSTNN